MKVYRITVTISDEKQEKTYYSPRVYLTMPYKGDWESENAFIGKCHLIFSEESNTPIDDRETSVSYTLYQFNPLKDIIKRLGCLMRFGV